MRADPFSYYACAAPGDNCADACSGGTAWTPNSPGTAPTSHNVNNTIVYWNQDIPPVGTRDASSPQNAGHITLTEVLTYSYTNGKIEANQDAYGSSSAPGDKDYKTTKVTGIIVSRLIGGTASAGISLAGWINMSASITITCSVDTSQTETTSLSGSLPAEQCANKEIWSFDQQVMGTEALAWEIYELQEYHGIYFYGSVAIGSGAGSVPLASTGSEKTKTYTQCDDTVQ